MLLHVTVNQPGKARRGKITANTRGLTLLFFLCLSCCSCLHVSGCFSEWVGQITCLSPERFQDHSASDQLLEPKRLGANELFW